MVLSPIATANLTALREVRKRNYPSEAQLVLLQQLAAQSIGTKDPARLRGLVLEQSLLIKELRLIQEHLEQLDSEIGLIVEHSREGQILTSIPPIGPIFAATIIATVGNTANFSRPSQLKSYFGWAPRREQTGVSFDRTRLTKDGYCIIACYDNTTDNVSQIAIPLVLLYPVLLLPPGLLYHHSLL